MIFSRAAFTGWDRRERDNLFELCRILAIKYIPSNRIITTQHTTVVRTERTARLKIKIHLHRTFECSILGSGWWGRTICRPNVASMETSQEIILESGRADGICGNCKASPFVGYHFLFSETSRLVRGAISVLGRSGVRRMLSTISLLFFFFFIPVVNCGISRAWN
jgi:hypothetical protein